MKTLKDSIKSTLRKAWRKVSGKKFSSRDYWEQRYRSGGNSGAGSYDELAEYKAGFLNKLVKDHNVHTVMEFGCGDGNQLTLAEYPRYVGYDVSATAVELCRNRFRDDPTKSFALVDDHQGQRADLAMSLDVLYHLVEDAVFESYMQKLFAAGDKLVVVYSSNVDEARPNPHVRHRKFTAWVERCCPNWTLIHEEQNPIPYDPETNTGSHAGFFVYAPRRES